MVLRICTSLGDCKESTESSFFGHRPSLIAGAVFMGVAGICLIANVAIGVKARRHVGFIVAMVLACAVTTSGWAARWAGARDPWLLWPWMQSTVALSIAPAFISIAIYLVLGPLVSIVGEEHTLVRPRIMTAALVASDLVALTVQCAGFGVAFADIHHNTLNVNAETYAGARIIKGGSALQLLTLLVALALLLVIAMRAARSARRSEGLASPAPTFFASAGAVVGSMTILAGRLGYRVAVLSDGLRGSVAQNWILFITLDGAAVGLALIALTALHPSLFLVPGRAGSVQGRQGRFEKLRDAEDVAFVANQDDGQTVLAAPIYSDIDRPPSSVPLQPMVFEPPKSYDLQPYEPDRYEPTRGDAHRRSLTPLPYETGDLSAANSRDTSPRQYGTGGI